MTAGGSNPESSDTASITHTIQYPVPDLLLEVDENPVLYPPGMKMLCVGKYPMEKILPLKIPALEL